MEKPSGEEASSPKLAKAEEETVDVSSLKSPKKGKKMSDGAKRIYTLLMGLNVLFHIEVRYAQCKDHLPLPFDFVIVINGRVGIIEYDGRQHFELVEDFHKNGEADFNKQKRHDITKNRFARDRSLSLLRVSYAEDKYIEKWVTEYVCALKTAKYPVYTFSSPLLYMNPFDDEPSRCVIA